MLRALLSAPSWVLPGASADLDFVHARAWVGGSTSLASLLATSRASSAYGTWADGHLSLFPANTSVITDLGLQVFQASTNLLTNSNDPSQASWAGNTNITAVGSAAMGPDNGTDAASIADNSANGGHQAAAASISFTNATTYTLSAYFKAGTATVVQLTFGAGAFSAEGYANFNLTNGTVAAIGGTLVASGIQALGNGWYRCWIAATATASASATPRINLTNNNTAATWGPSYSGSGQTLYMWGAQVEALSFPTPPIATTSATVTRAADNITAVGTLLTAILNAKAARFVTNGAMIQPGAARLIDLPIQALDYPTSTTINAFGSGGSAIATIGGSVTYAAQVKSAFGFDASSLTAVANGGTKVTNAVAWGSTSSPIYLGSHNGTAALNGCMLRMSFGISRGQFDNLTTGNNPS